MRSSRTLADLKGNISGRTIDFLSLIVIAFRILEVLEGSQSASLWPLIGNLSEKHLTLLRKQTTNKKIHTETKTLSLNGLRTRKYPVSNLFRRRMDSSSSAISLNNSRRLKLWRNIGRLKYGICILWGYCKYLDFLKTQERDKHWRGVGSKI